MFLTLRIVFTVLAAACVAAVIPVGVYFGWLWAGICVLGAVAFYLLMLLCKQSQESREKPFDGTFTERETREEKNEKGENLSKDR